mmetsp:Transcript_6775/g.17738  ORF Transcript_6775/g.17738 Transcript_6775/m.17738 type:complete len:328 (-) Transcript_6775:375-1358(-)
MSDEKAAKKAKLDPALDPARLSKQCMGVLAELMAVDIAEPFNVKVDWKGLGLHDYPKVVKHPMDLGTIKDKLKSSKYATTADLAQDVRLVWKNAKSYNQEGSEIHIAASSLEADFEAKFQHVPRGPLRASDTLAKAKEIVKQIRKLPNADPFNEPVDWEGLKLDDYLDVIKQPMDLGTILRRLDAGSHFSSVEAVYHDIELVWRNAMMYNMEGSAVHEAARKLKTLTEKRFSDLLREAGEHGFLESGRPKEVTFEMKQELVSSANELTPKELYGVVYIVTQNAATAISSTSEEEVEVDIDNLDHDAFVLVDRYVKDCLAKKKLKKKS